MQILTRSIKPQKTSFIYQASLKYFRSQDDFFKNSEQVIAKVERVQKDIQFDYTGRIADRQTEDDYTTENLMLYDQKFADKVVVQVEGGNGGHGCVSFQRENYGFKIPDGGSGGKGGDVYFRASSRLQNLYELRRAHFKGNSGKSGKGEKGIGTDGKDVRFTVPLGTEIYEVKMSEKAKELAATNFNQVKIKVADLDSEGSEFRMAKGGAGGLGNL